jgi:two-component system, cell cycle sensor histidine kinase and response regulator CckA
MKVLIADDHSANLKLLRAQLEAEGQVVLEAGDGLAALEILRQEPVDALITDILMPRMDGYRLCFEVRRNPATRDVPIVVYTATYTTAADEKLALDLGAGAYLRKPAGVPEILHALDAVTRARPTAVAIGLPDDLSLLREYSERLVTKLEEKNVELAATVAQAGAQTLALRESEARFRLLVETIREVFWVAAEAGSRVLYVSPAYEAIWGRSCESLYASVQGWTETIDPRDRARMLEAKAAKPVRGGYDETYRIVRPDGSLRWVRERVFPVADEAASRARVVGVVEDVTERTELEEQFRRGQRLESIGMLAAGITHDLNNVLAPIMMAASLLRSNARHSDDVGLLDTLEQCSQRGAGLVRQILGFVHGIGGEPRLVQVKHLLADITGVVTQTFPKSIVLEQHVTRDLWPIMANPTQIHQVLLNLCVNARDAMPHGGTLHLRAENVSLDATTARAIDGAAPGAWLMLHIQDTGTGIPSDILPRIWEPFYTTKGAGKGTGLGLSTVRAIVESHRGFITLETTPRLGTSFRLYLPAVVAPVVSLTSARSPAAQHGRGELILIVDDEEPMRELVAASLTKHGYRVISAADGIKAMFSYVSHAAEIALVITDLEMPRMGGAAFARAVRRLDPTEKILAMSGEGGRNALADAGIEEFADGFIPKPFTPQALLTAVARLLRGADAGSPTETDAACVNGGEAPTSTAEPFGPSAANAEPCESQR